MKKARRLTAVAAVTLAAAALTPGTGQAGPDAAAQGVTSAWVEHVKFVPTEPVLGTGAHLVGNYFYLTSSKNLSIYNVSNPEDPQLVSYIPFKGTQWENEDVATNGKILVFSQTGNVPIVGGGQNLLRVYDVTDKANPVEIAAATGLGQHTMTCVLDCTYLYGSGGNIIDLRDPTKPTQVGSWGTKAGVATGHDVREDAPGLVVNSSGGGSNCPGAILDASDPPNPKKLACMGAGQKTGEYMHSTSWANQATDKFMLAGTETNLAPRCGATNGATYVYNMTNWQSGTYTKSDRLQGKNGFLFDGNPAVNVLGCSAHWVEAAPSFHNGGIFAQGYYEHGTRFFYVNGAGKLTPVGFFTPFGGSTSAAYWITDRILYSVDYQRGFDILRWNGPLPSDPGAATAVKNLTASTGGAVGGTATFAGEPAPVVTATDPAGDGPINADLSGTAGVDLTEASVSQPQAGLPYLEFRWKVTNLPGPDTAPATAPEVIRYVWSFSADGKGYQVQAKLSNNASSTAADDPAGHPTHVGRAFQLRGNCETIQVLANCHHLAWLDGSFDVANKVVSVRVPIGASFAPEIAPGAVVSTPAAGAPGLSSPYIYAAYQAAVSNSSTWDAVEWDPEGEVGSSYTIPNRTVSLGVAPAGTEPSQVSYSTKATLHPDGSFTGDAGTVPDGSQVFARACFGTSCAYDSVAPA